MQKDNLSEIVYFIIPMIIIYSLIEMITAIIKLTQHLYGELQVVNRLKVKRLKMSRKKLIN